jgi:3-oxoacyl-[acyl-carrier protein] reductase
MVTRGSDDSMSDETRLDGLVALVTGAGAGMGRAHALLLAERGADVVVQDINEATAADTAARVRALGRRSTYFAFDIADVPAIERMMAAVERELGGLDVLVNNAGIGGENAVIEDIDEKRFARMFDVHAKGTFFCGRGAMALMKKRGRGKIINTATRWALSGHETSSHYICAKAAILGMTKAWAKELAPHKINVNAVAPGGVWTDMVLKARGPDFIRAEAEKVPLKRWAQPEEYAYLVAFLASPQADFITGQVISPNGGATIVGF